MCWDKKVKLSKSRVIAYSFFKPKRVNLDYHWLLLQDVNRFYKLVLFACMCFIITEILFITIFTVTKEILFIFPYRGKEISLLWFNAVGKFIPCKIMYYKMNGRLYINEWLNWFLLNIFSNS